MNRCCVCLIQLDESEMKLAMENLSRCVKGSPVVRPTNGDEIGTWGKLAALDTSRRIGDEIGDGKSIFRSVALVHA